MLRFPGAALAVLAAAVSILLPVRLAGAGAVQVLAPVVEADGRLGLCDVLPGKVPGSSGLNWADLAYNAGARVNRWEFRWDRTEPKPGTWSFSADDAAVDSSRKAGLDILGILIGTPSWAAADGQRPGNGVPRGLYRPYTDPANLWAAYVRRTVAHYRGQVRDWEVWNEPDLRFFWMGTPHDYYRLLKVTYLAVKAADLRARVVMAGMVVPDLAFVRQVLREMTRDPQATSHGPFFDAVAWHAYGPARLLFTNLERYRGALRDAGLGAVPVWVTEAGFPASNPNGESRQAAYVLQTVAFALAAGADRVLVYRASDSTEPKAWGVVSAMGTPRMGYVAFQVAAQFFSHTQALTYDPASHVERFAFYRPRDHVTLFWNKDVADHTATVSADGPSAQLVDWLGSSTALQARNGQVQFVVPGAAYNAGVDPQGAVVGGPPVMLVQDDAAPTGLTQAMYIPPFQGTGRQLILLNYGATPAAVQVVAASERSKRVVLELPPGSLQTVDLNLLAGPTYAGMYLINSSTPVAAKGASSFSTAEAVTPSTTWYLPASPHHLVLGNPGRQPTRVDITTYGRQGRIRVRENVVVPASQQLSYSLPSQAAGVVSVWIRAAAPVGVTSESSLGPPGAGAPAPTWYAVHPKAAALALFAPDAQATTQVDVGYVGAGAVQGAQLRLQPRHLLVLPTHGASAVYLKATKGIAVSYADESETSGSLVRQLSTDAAFAASGASRRLSVFNPGDQPAHVSLTIRWRDKVAESRRVIAPSSLRSFDLGDPAAGPRGVVLKSDVPVAAGSTQ